MNNEYIIINKSQIEKRIEELEKEIKFLTAKDACSDIGKISALKQILSQSTPLIPEIEKAFKVGVFNGYYYGNASDKNIKNSKQDYISNLKLDI